MINTSTKTESGASILGKILGTDCALRAAGDRTTKMRVSPDVLRLIMDVVPLVSAPSQGITPSIFGIPIIVSESLPKNTIIMYRGVCDYCGERVGLLDMCPHCGGPVLIYGNSSVVVKLAEQEKAMGE